MKYRSLHSALFAAISLTVIAACGGRLLGEQPESLHLFNGRDFQGWYVHTVETGYKNPDVFQVIDGAIYVPGGKGNVAYFGGLITEQSYENYRLEFEYKWGENTYGRRHRLARDAGVLLHCVGPHGAGPWLSSYEFQIIEGGTGDLLVVNPARGVEKPVALHCTAETKTIAGQLYFHPGGENTLISSGRLNWLARDPNWKDEAGFRGRQDLENPRGEWTKCEVVARDDTLEYRVNGQLVNRAEALNVHRGKIFFQTEGAAVWYRNIVLTPLDLSNARATEPEPSHPAPP